MHSMSEAQYVLLYIETLSSAAISLIGERNFHYES
jgi:hypothetical protein